MGSNRHTELKRQGGSHLGNHSPRSEPASRHHVCPGAELGLQLYFVAHAKFLHFVFVFKNQKFPLKCEFQASFENSEDGSCLGR